MSTTFLTCTSNFPYNNATIQEYTQKNTSKLKSRHLNQTFWPLLNIRKIFLQINRRRKKSPELKIVFNGGRHANSTPFKPPSRRKREQNLLKMHSHFSSLPTLSFAWFIHCLPPSHIISDLRYYYSKLSPLWKEPKVTVICCVVAINKTYIRPFLYLC